MATASASVSSSTGDPSELPPSGIRAAFDLHRHTGNALFIWGSPGLAKSATAMQVANERGVAFVDVRLSMYAPTDVHGMPYRVEENGQTVGVAFSPPKILPRDLDIDTVKVINAMPTPISFKGKNPKGVNGIYYVKSPEITVQSLDDGLTAEIMSQTPESFIVRLVDAEGKTRAGTVHYTVTGEAEGVVALEELNSAPLATQQAAYQFILDRRIGEYIVPKGVQLAAMGNFQTDKGLTYNQPTPLANRFVHLIMKMVYSEWEEWAVRNLIHPMVVGYLSANKASLHVFDPKNAKMGFATPRSWEFVSNMLHQHDRNPVDSAVLFANICGAVGMTEGAKFRGFMQIRDKVPTLDQIMSGNATLDAAHRGNPAVGFWLVTSTAYELRLRDLALLDEGIASRSKDQRRLDYYKAFNNVMEFYRDNLADDITIMGVRSMMVIHNLSIDRTQIPALAQVVKENSDMISKR